ncbi:MAG: hypothetical protein ACOCYF_01110 [Bacteroidota bacterium]
MLNKCLDCGELLKGRIDKKFCSDACRINFHNQRNRHLNNLFRRVNLQLSRNRRLLDEFYSAGRTMLALDELRNNGFSPKYITHVEKTDHHLLYFCYDYGYFYIDEDEIAIVKA